MVFVRRDGRRVLSKTRRPGGASLPVQENQKAGDYEGRRMQKAQGKTVVTVLLGGFWEEVQDYLEPPVGLIADLDGDAALGALGA